jgi:hypothetical protein
MISRRGHIVRASITRVPAFAMAFAAALVACASSPVIGPAFAQETRPPGELAPSAAQPVPAAPSRQEGFIDTFGRWLEQGADRFKSNMQNAQDQLDKLSRETRESTRDATTAVVGLPNARIVEAREPCVLAQNGAPDCHATALALCRAKGFAAGKSLDTRTEQKCKSARFLVEGRAPTSSECPTQIFVARAMCQ